MKIKNLTYRESSTSKQDLDGFKSNYTNSHQDCNDFQCSPVQVHRSLVDTVSSRIFRAHHGLCVFRFQRFPFDLYESLYVHIPQVHDNTNICRSTTEMNYLKVKSYRIRSFTTRTKNALALVEYCVVHLAHGDGCNLTRLSKMS